jgi:vacuolar-type H+-ATPase subunit E/Vma4
MGLPELLDALEQEVEHQVREIIEQAHVEGERHLARIRGELAASSRTALETERTRLAAIVAHTQARLRIEHERAILATKRELLAILRAEIEQRSNHFDPAVLLPHLVDELVPEVLDEPMFRLRVRAPHAELVRRDLQARHPDLARRAVIEGVPEMASGVALVVDREVLDNTVPSRLRKLWPVIEGKLAAMLFGEPREQP